MDLPRPVRELIENFVFDTKMVDDELPKKVKFWQPWITPNQSKNPKGILLLL